MGSVQRMRADEPTKQLAAGKQERFFQQLGLESIQLMVIKREAKSLAQPRPLLMLADAFKQEQRLLIFVVLHFFLSRILLCVWIIC